MSLNYDEMVFLDAEALAERGIQRAYDGLLPKLRRYVPQPAIIEEHSDGDIPRYAVTFGGKEFVIVAPEVEDEEGNSWGRATHALFHIVNEQLAGTACLFYAINGGNDLGGMFLTPEEADEAMLSLPKKADWPYLPTDEPPDYGAPA